MVSTKFARHSSLNPFLVNKQQVDRKRHIGNDVITIIFQEPGAAPFSPAESGVRSQFQHIFVIVRAHKSKSSDEGTSDSSNSSFELKGTLICCFF